MKKIIIISRGSITYYLKEESVIVAIGDKQFLSYSVYMLQNRKPFYKFKRTLLASTNTEYNTPSKLLKLADDCNIMSFGVGRPNLEDYEITWL